MCGIAFEKKKKIYYSKFEIVGVFIICQKIKQIHFSLVLFICFHRFQNVFDLNIYMTSVGYIVNHVFKY